nr:hypothetical protein GCM10020241_53060 [Streptoalloteichus tenebrarius]
MAWSRAVSPAVARPAAWAAAADRARARDRRSGRVSAADMAPLLEVG